jgi:hypothetical protein
MDEWTNNYTLSARSFHARQFYCVLLQTTESMQYSARTMM